MDIKQTLIRLRDDLKTWVTNNLIKLNTKVDKKVDKVEGKGLSTNDFTDAYKNKIDNYNGSGGGGIGYYDEFGNVVITNSDGNVILRSNGDTIEITNLAVENIAIEGKTIQEVIKEYVNEAILGGAW